MEACFITTYRCNAHCQMCNIWKKESDVSREIETEILKKLPEGIKRINISGGEPSIRKDLVDIVAVLNSKAEKLDISTNGFFTDRLVEVGRRFPDVAFRISLEGLPELNDSLRGIKNGFDHSLRSIIRLRQIGVTDVGFGVVISDKTKDELLDLYNLCVMLGVDFGSSTMHNSFYFDKYDNVIDDIEGTVEEMHRFIEALLTSKRTGMKLRMKDWGRAYINYGIMKHIQEEKRPIQCGAGTELFFLDPYGLILACNGSEVPLIMGDLKKHSFDAIWHGKQADSVREKVSKCERNCWMVGSARPAMRSHPWAPLKWIVKNKAKLTMKMNIWC